RRSTTRLSGEPPLSIAESSPATIAITVANTATTSAIPTPVIVLDTRRTSRLRRLYLSGIAISGYGPQGIHDVASCRRCRRHDRAEQTDERRNRQGQKKNSSRHPNRTDYTLHSYQLEDHIRPTASKQPARECDNQRFREEHRKNDMS